jgi:sulfur carrier protein ThiS
MASNCTLGIQNLVKTTLNNKPWFQYDQSLGIVNILDSFTKKINKENSHGVAKTTAITINKQINDGYKNIGDIAFVKSNKEGRGYIDIAPTINQIYLINAQDEKEIYELQKELDEERETEYFEKRSEYSNEYINDDGDLVSKEDLNNFQEEQRELDKIVADINNLEDETKSDILQVGNSSLNQTIKPGVQGTLFQVKNIFNSIKELEEKLSSLNKTSNSIGSNKNLDDILKKAGIESNLRKEFIQLLEDNKSLKSLKLSEVLSSYLKEFIKESDRQYYKAIDEPLSQELENTLIQYFDKFHIRRKELDNLKEKFGVDSIGVFDVLAKTIYYSKNRNLLTLPEEYGHVFVELLGSIGNKKADNPLFKYMFDNIDSWDGYQRVYRDYKNIYLTAEGNTDIYKIKKEAIGQAIGIALVRNYKVQKGDKDFWGKIQEIIDYILNLIKGIDYVSLNTTVDNIAKDILSKNYSKLDRLKKDTSNYSLLSYSETIKNQNKIDGGKALKFMQWFSQKGMIITGSLAYRLQGNVYRPEIDALHDIDNIVPSDIHGVNLLKENFLNSEQLEQDKLYRKYITEGNYNEAKKYKIQGNLKLNLKEQVDKIQVLKDFKLEFPDTDFLYSFYNQKANAYYVTINAIWSENKELKDRFKSYSGSFNSRLENFTKEELEQIYLFDFFLRPETTDHFKKIEDKEYGLSLAHFNYSFYEKLNMMGRPKDAFDYQMWDYNDENNILAPDFNDRLVYFQIDQSKKENTSTDQIKPGVEELFESNPELANEVYEALGFQGSISLESNLKNTGKTEKELTDYLKNKYPEIKLNITNNPLWEISDNVFNQLIQDDYFEGNPKYVTEVERISNLILNKLKFKTREFNGKYDESITDLQTYKTKVLNDLLKEIGITGVVTNLNELKERLNSKELQTSLKENLGQVKESKENFNNQLGNFYSIKRLLNNYLKHLDLSKYDSSQQATIKKHLNNLFKDNKFKSEKQAIAFNKRRINSEEWANKVFNLDKITLGFLGNNAREKKIETLLNYFKIEPKDAAERIYVTIENELNRRERFFTSEKTQAKINAKIAEEKIKLDNEKAERERIRTKELNKFKESTVVSEVEGIIGGRNIHSLEKVLESESINEELAIIKNNGYSLDKTPNGKKSNLYESILALPEVNGNTEIANKLKSLIYSNNFTNWFGDWVNNPEESSKIVDENGEPKLVYHGSGREYNKFSEEKRGSATGKWKDRLSDSEMSFMFTDNPSVAFYYAIIERQQILGEILYYVRKARQEPTQQLITEMYEKYPSIKYWVNSLKEKGLEKTEILEEFKRIYREYSEIRELSEGGAIGNSNSYLNNMRTAISYLQENKSKILKNGFSKDIGKSTTAKVPNLGKHHTVFLYSSKEYRTSYILADGRLTGFEDKSLNDKNIKDLSSEEYDKIVLQFQEDYVYLYNKIEDELKAGGFQPKIYPVFLNAKSVNSKDFKGRPFMFQEGDTEELVKNRKSKGAAFEVADLVEEALNSGLGGSIIENIADPNVGTNYSVFKANQIKSIFNEEEYSSKNDSFYNQLVNGRIVGQANIKAMTVLVDAVNKKEDTIPHEYAHHYIAWFRNTPIVQEAIKRFGSEEALVQAIGEQVVKQKGEAYNWWKKFTNWILSLLSDKQLLQILTDSFLNRQNLNNFTYNNVGTEQVKKFAELQERLNNKEFLEGAKNAFESSKELQNVYYEAAEFRSDRDTTVRNSIVQAYKNKTTISLKTSLLEDLLEFDRTKNEKFYTDKELTGVENIKKLKESIKKDGLKEPLELVINSQGAVVLAEGNHRFQALKELGYKEIPVIVKGRGSKDEYFTEVRQGKQVKLGLNLNKDFNAQITPQQKQEALNAYTDYIARVSLGIIKNPSSGGYNYTSKVKDIVYHFSNVKIDKPDKEKFTLSANINRRKGFFGISKNINPGNNFANVEGTIPHAMLFDMKNPDFGDFSIIPPIVAKDDSKDSAIIKQRGDIDYYSVFEPEQIHILGSKQDVEGFKEFLSDTQKTEDYFNEEIKKIQKESKTIDEKISKFESTQKIDNKNTSKALQNMQEKVKIIGDKLLSLGFESINEKEHDFKTSSYITFKSKLKELENLDIDINTFKSPDYLIKTKIKSFKNNFNSQKQGELPFNPIELKIALSENEFIKDIADNTFEGLTDEQIKILKENLDKGEFNLNCKI